LGGGSKINTNFEEEKYMREKLKTDLINKKVEGIKIDGKNAEIRAAQLREASTTQRVGVQEQEYNLEAKKVKLSNLRTELQISLALVELIKGVA
jgi:hypothetical protein